MSTHLDGVFTAKIGAAFGYMAQVFCVVLKTYPRLDFLISSMKTLKMMLEHPSANDKSLLIILGCSGKVRYS